MDTPPGMTRPWASSDVPWRKRVGRVCRSEQAGCVRVDSVLVGAVQSLEEYISSYEGGVQMIATATVLRIKILVLVAVFAVGLMLGFGISASSLHVQASVQRNEPMPLFNE